MAALSLPLVLGTLAVPRIAAATPPGGTERLFVPTGFGSIDDADPIPTPRTGRLDAALVPDPSGTTLVEVTGDAAAITDDLSAIGAERVSGLDGLVLARVANDRLGTLAASSGVTSVRAATPVTDEHLDPTLRIERGNTTGQHQAMAQAWHDAGYTGAGSKVGILGLFDETVLDKEIATFELPPIPTGHRTCISAGASCPFGTPGATYGNSLTEIVADLAPDTDFYLAEIGYKLDYLNAIDWFAANGVNILLNPIIWPYDGPGDGTGLAAAIIDYAVSKGIAWFNTAGEMSPGLGGVYWRGTWNDPDNDRLLNWYGNDESMTIYCGYLLGLRWSDWGGPLTDYDLLISDYRANNGTYGTRTTLSANNQSLAGAEPLEGTGVSLCNHNAANGPVYDTNGDGYVSLWVQRTTRTTNSPTGDIIELGTYYGWMERYTDGKYSVSHPFADSRSTGMLTVGTDGNLDIGYPRSGWGPTNDGRLKPELVAKGCIATSVDGGLGDDSCSNEGFAGSDAATAVAVGIAALTSPVTGAVTPLQITRYVRDQGLNAGREHPERTSLDTWFAAISSPPPTTYPATTLQIISPYRTLDTRGAPIGPVGTNLVQRIKANETVHLEMFGGGTAVVLNVGMVKASAKGYLSIYPTGWGVPGLTSAVNVEVSGQVRSNLVVIPVGDGNGVDIFSSVETDLIVDVLGLFVTSNTGRGLFQPTTPTRIADTRTCLGIPACTGDPIVAKTWTAVDIGAFDDPNGGWMDVPANASAAFISVTIDDPQGAGWLSVVPGDSTVGATSNLNYDSQRNATALAMVRLDGGAAGKANIFASVPAHFQVDLLGWFTGAGGAGDPSGTFVPLTPYRTLDSRVPQGSPALAPDTVTTVDAAPAGVPADAAAILMNNAAVLTGAAGELQVADVAQPTPPAFRNLSAGAAGLNIAAATVTRADDATYTIRNSMTTHVISDVWGYFRPSATTRAPAGATVEVPITGLTTYNCCSQMLISDDGEVIATVTRSSTPPWQDVLAIWRRSTNDVITLFETHSPRLIGLSSDGSTVLVQAYDPGLDDFALIEVDTATGVPTLIGPAPATDDFKADASLNRLLVRTKTSHDVADTVPNSYNFYLYDRIADTYTFLPTVSGQAKLTRDGHHVGWEDLSSQLRVLDLDSMATATVELGGIVGSFALNDDGSKGFVITSSFPYYGGAWLVDMATATKQALPFTDPDWNTPYWLGSMWIAPDGSEVAYGHNLRYTYAVAVPSGPGGVAYHTEWGTYPGYDVSGIMSPNGRFIAVLTSSPVMVGQSPGTVLLLQDRWAA